MAIGWLYIYERIGKVLNICTLALDGTRGVLQLKEYWDDPYCTKKLDRCQGRVHDTNLLMIGRSISSPASFRHFEPSMAGMYTSLMTASNLFSSSMGNSCDLVALPHVRTERKYKDVWRAPKTRGWNPKWGSHKVKLRNWNLVARSPLPTLERGRGSSWEPRD